jgi:Zn-dependent M28 family amino/carboxypeptidase
MVAAAMDSLALFHPNATGANADMSGVIALLGAARVLGNPENAAARNLKRNIFFTLFHVCAQEREIQMTQFVL